MSAKHTCDIHKLGTELLHFAGGIAKLDTPYNVLDSLHKITFEICQINVLAAHMFPVRWGDRSGAEKGKTIFLHKTVPDGWLDEYQELSEKHPGPGLMIARLAIAPFTMSEIMRTLEPLGIERWSIELALKYGMRDIFTCPVGGRWVVAFWSRYVLSDRLTAEARAILFMGATFAAVRLQQLVEPQSCRIGERASLTPRELSVLRLMSLGHQIKDAAELLGLGEETIRTHMKKAQHKLGAYNRTHAVAQAIRRYLIP